MILTQIRGVRSMVSSQTRLPGLKPSRNASRVSPPRAPSATLITDSVASEALKDKAELLAASEIAFVDHPDFRRRNGHALVEAQRPAAMESPPPRRTTTGPGIAFMPELVKAALLSQPQERYLFLKMNFLRFRAEQSRRKLRPSHPDIRLMNEIEAYLNEALAIRNTIAEANVRLLVATARKLCQSLDQLSELIGEGLVPLLRAIDLFDVGRGHRFSTYATWAVRNQMIRLLRKQRTLPELALTDEQAAWQHVPDHRRPMRDESTFGRGQQCVSTLVRTLTEREQQIVRARFGLDGEPAGQSLADISLQLGLSKERIRQVAIKALQKMRQQAELQGVRFDDEEFPVP